jgi:hypothetical protein
MKLMGRAGTSRLTWDLRHDAPKQIELRTTPPDNPNIWSEPRFRNTNGTRPIVHWGIQGPQRTGPIASPGRYTLRMTVDGTPYNQAFTVVKDPDIQSSVGDLALSTAMQAKVLTDINATVEMVNRLEIARKQMEDLIKADSTNAASKAELRALDAKALDIELKLLSRSDLHSDDKWYVEQYKVYLNLLWFAGEIGTGAGDVAGGADYRPTDAQHKVLAEIEQELTTAKTAFDTFIKNTLPEFNKTMSGKLVPISDERPKPRPVIVP